MGTKTKIGWTDHTQNFWWGCAKVSTECTHCYIDAIMRHAGKKPFRGPIRTSETTWRQPFSWDRLAKMANVRRRVFTCSMSDFFHPGADEWRPEAWRVIRECSHLDWLVLTKRPELIADRLPRDWGDGYANVWMGVTVGAASSMQRIGLLKRVLAFVRFISAEPLLERLDFTPHLDGSIHWIITGCEQAAKRKRRRMEWDWVRDIDRQCRRARIAHFLKQYYVDEKGVPVYDGMLDGRHRQAWPVSFRPSNRRRVGVFRAGE